MPDYKKMYFMLTAKVSDAVNILIEAQKQGENEYVENPPELVLLKQIKPEDGNEPLK